MIIFKTIKYQNFLGAGNAAIEIQLNKSKTTLVTGKNGSGKSSGLLDGITFGLFGKPFRDIKKNQLINTINGKKCLVQITFSIGTKEYLVKRGIKPDVFEIHIDGKLLDQVAGVVEYQKILEEQILQMNLRTFKQVVLLSVANFKPFMQLDAKERRLVIEDILDINIFSLMNDALKKRVSVLQESIRTVDNSIDVHKQKIEVQKRYVDTLCVDKQAKEEELTNEIAGANKKIDELESQIETHNKEIEELLGTISDADTISAKITKLTPIASPLQGKLDTLKKKIEFYSATEVCPTCSQDIDDSVKKKKVEDYEKKIEEVNTAIDKLQAQLDDIRKREGEIVQVKRTIATTQQKIQSINNTIIAEQQYIRRLNNELNGLIKSTGNIEQEKAKIKELSESAMVCVKQKSELSETKQYYDIASTLLKDSGIKTKIIDQYVPIINKLINRYLDLMGVWINFTLDSEFNETIKSRYRDTFTYSSFSEGEKQRIDLAILFTWRMIAKMKNSVSTNLLVMDEIVDKCLDHAGVESVAQILESLGDGTNVFVISHKVEELQDKFTSTLSFDKVNNFSQIVSQ